MDDDAQVVVLDTGSHSCKVGIAGDDAPRAVFRSVVGRPRDPAAAARCVVGADALAHRGTLALSEPVERGMVTSWEDVEQLWQHAFVNELHMPSEEHPVLLTDAVGSPTASRERLVELMCETFNPPALYVASQATLSMYASGRTTGLVLGCGHGLSYAVPVFDGHALPHAAQRMDLAGRDVTAHLAQLLRERGVSLGPTAEMDVVREMKEQCCAAALEPGALTAAAAREQTYELPDGQTITLRSERLAAAEILFTPSSAGREAPGLGGLAHAAIAACPIDLRRALSSAVILSGASTLLGNIAARLHADMAVLAPRSAPPCIVAAADRQHAAWLGGSMVGCLSNYKDMWISRSLYAEIGPSAATARLGAV